MLGYILERILYGFTILLGVVTLVFFLFNLKPGDPARMLGGQFADEQILANINRDLGLDQPLMKRYVLYLNDISPLSWHQVTNPNEVNYLDSAKYSYSTIFKSKSGAFVVKAPYLRRSYQTKKNVSAILGETIPGTALIALAAIVFAFVIGIGLGIVAAVQQNKFTDQFILFVSVIGMSGPSFFVAIIFSWLGGYLWSEAFNLPIVPVAISIFWVTAVGFYKKSKGKLTFNPMLEHALGALVIGVGCHFMLVEVFQQSIVLKLPGTHLNMTGSLYTIDPFQGKVLSLKNIILPALTLGIRPLAVVVQLTRSSLLEVMEQDYIRTARAKGLSETKVILNHALKNALNPVITAVSGWFASLLAGAVFVEFVFGWKGLGLEVFQALEKEDLPVVTGAVLFFAAVFVCMNILVDALYGWLDPRVRMN